MRARLKTSYQKGIDAESIARDYLTTHGYEILKMRYKTKYGEIDIVACLNNMIAFIEVKARGSVEDALYSITPRMQARIQNAALMFISEHPQYQDYDMRFDVMAIARDEQGFLLKHLDNAWLAI